MPGVGGMHCNNDYTDTLKYEKAINQMLMKHVAMAYMTCIDFMN